MEQGSPEWLEARIGKLTASCAKEWICQKGQVTDTARSYLLKKLGEIKTGLPSDNYINEDMIYGQEQEPIARKWYTKLMGIEVEQVGFLLHPELNYLGASLDGKIQVEDVKGTIEIKCPVVRNLHTHLKYCMIDSPEVFKKLAPDHYWQIQTGLMVTDSEFCDFVSFYPFLEDKTGFFTFRLRKDESAFATIRHSAEMCYKEMQRMAQVLKIEMPTPVTVAA